MSICMNIQDFGVYAKPLSACTAPLSNTFSYVVRSCLHIFKNLFSQPLDGIASYYGEDVAFYFAWLAFYTKWLVPLSVLGTQDH